MNTVRFEQVSTTAWNINNSYAVGTKVRFGDNQYVSKKNVPCGINIGMSNYWKKLELADDVTELSEKVTSIDEDVTAIKSDITTINTNITGLQNKINFSTNEVKCGTFYDGTNTVDVYKKTINVGSLPNNTTTQTPHGITDLGLILQIFGSAKDSDGNYIPIPDATITPNPTYNENTNILLRVNATNIELTTRVNRSTFSGYVTMIYTKSETEEG